MNRPTSAGTGERGAVAGTMARRGVTPEAAWRLAPYAEVLAAHPDLLARVRGSADGAGLAQVARDRRLRAVYRVRAWQAVRPCAEPLLWLAAFFTSWPPVLWAANTAGWAMPAPALVLAGCLACIAAGGLLGVVSVVLVCPLVVDDSAADLALAAVALVARG